jgi:hypothetical protein
MEKREEGEERRVTCGPIIKGYIRHLTKKSRVRGAGVRLHAKQNVCSKNCTIELLHGGVGRAELKN